MALAAATGPHQLVVQTSFLGDTVLTTPLIAELARRGPVDVVVTPASAPLLARNPDIHELFVYDKRGADAGLRGFRRLAQRVRAPDAREGAPPAVAYLAQRSMRSGALALAAGYTRRVGFEESAGQTLYTTRVPYREDRHHAERLWRLAFPDASDRERDAAPPMRPKLFPGDADRAAVDALLGTSDRRPLLALAPGSVWATKRWPYYGLLAQKLAARFRIAVIGGPDDRSEAASIAEFSSAQGVVDGTASLSLLASAELIGRANLMVTNDSAPQHLASAMGTPTITIFGPTVEDFGFGPLAPHSISLGLDALACRPCHHHGPPRCPLGHWRCMRELEVDAVASAVDEVLGAC
ncbi:MAG TPA: glycosyltransferase family 9 protein [Gemmatimonadaceae bacterium]|nr:glycosyltransferase family 9 protein [Gemmatimonadaceae bacterium]